MLWLPTAALPSWACSPFDSWMNACPDRNGCTLPRPGEGGVPAGSVCGPEQPLRAVGLGLLNRMGHKRSRFSFRELVI